MVSTSRFIRPLLAAALLVSVTAGSALAGEITGNGRLLEVKGQSACAFSGQEDRQWFYDDEQLERKPTATRGDPSHAQSWGQIPKAERDYIAAEFGAHPGNACNPAKGSH